MHQPLLPPGDETQHMTFEDKTVVLLHSESGTYREWLVTVGRTEYCLVDEDDTWTLMYYVPDIAGWCDAPDNVDDFLSTHKLILAA